MFVRVSDVSFSYRDSVQLLSGVNLSFARGWTGIVGPNGFGKSTLLKIVGGELTPDRGHVRCDPPGIVAKLCPQAVETITAEIVALAESNDGAMRRIAGQLRLDPAQLARWDSLSPGERRRWQIGAALAAEPGVLLLDEPTDHLDSDARDFLLTALHRFGGIGIVVSHDRGLLDSLTSHTVRFHQGIVRMWRGSYTEAKRAWEAEEREYREHYERLKHEAEKLRRRLADKRRAYQSAQAQMDAGSRMKGARDHDATGMFAKGKVAMASARIGRDVAVLRRKTERTLDDLRAFRFEKDPGRSIFVDYVAALRDRLLSLDATALRGGDKLLLEEAHVVLRREDRVRIAGPNGIGKSTLLAAMLAHPHVPPDRILYLPQELRAEEASALAASVRELNATERSRVLTIAAALGVEPEHILETNQPSPGEARKLKMAYGLATQVWALVLDEPTNHLDMPAIERLEAMLVEYPGALMIVTHDEMLAHRCVSVEWTFENRRLVVRSIQES
jgi:ATPase subunit of ABC transporter with duplicated ATPase domains